MIHALQYVKTGNYTSDIYFMVSCPWKQIELYAADEILKSDL